jgi:hypothetical protein
LAPKVLSQGWKTFLRNHADGIVRPPNDLVSAAVWTSGPATFVARAFVVGLTAHPNAEWIARQLTEACGWSERPRYITRDRDGAYGEAFIRRLTAMGIRDLFGDVGRFPLIAYGSVHILFPGSRTGWPRRGRRN